MLKLTTREKNILLGLNLNPPSAEEIDEAIYDSEKILSDSRNGMFFADEFLFLWKPNDNMLDMLDVPRNEAKRKQFVNKKRGTHLLKGLFDPSLPMRTLVPKEKWQ